MILSPELRKFVHPDSLNEYVSGYRTLLETFYDENEIQLAINQQNLFNYQIHEREKAKTVESKEKMKIWITAFLFIILLMAFVILYLKNRNKRHLLELHHSLENIDRLKKKLNSTLGHSADDEQMEGKEAADDSPVSNRTEQELREKLKNELISLSEKYGEKPVSPVILQSEAYQKLQKKIFNGEQLKDNDNLWDELEQTVLECSPKFKINLSLLTSGNLTTIDMRTALLIKCGIKPSQMTILFGRTNGAIISRRSSLCVRILDKKSSVKVIDSIIRLL